MRPHRSFTHKPRWLFCILVHDVKAFLIVAKTFSYLPKLMSSSALSHHHCGLLLLLGVIANVQGRWHRPKPQYPVHTSTDSLAKVSEPSSWGNVPRKQFNAHMTVGGSPANTPLPARVGESTLSSR